MLSGPGRRGAPGGDGLQEAAERPRERASECFQGEGALRTFEGEGVCRL